MKTMILSLVFVSLFASVVNGQYPGTNVRGQIVGTNQFAQQFPVVSAKVDLYYFNTGIRQWQYLATSYTDQFGFFFFQRLPVNTYVISVNGLRSYTIHVIPIDYRFYQFQELGSFFY